MISPATRLVEDASGWLVSEDELRAAVSSLGIPFKGGTPEYHKAYNALKKQGKLGKTPPTPGALPSATVAAPSGASLDTANMKQVAGQQGSNPAGVFQAQDGTTWYVKKGKSPEHVNNEVLAAALYKEAGVAVPEIHRATFKGQPGVASKIVPTDSVAPSALQNLPGAHEGFAADAWLGNWDVVGLNNDNLKSVGNKAMRIDVGGSLAFRAKGAPKGRAFGDEVLELNSLRNPATNPRSANVFSSISDKKLDAGIANVLRIPDSRIRAIVEENWPGNTALADKLIKRKNSLRAQRPSAATISALASMSFPAFVTLVSGLGIPFKGGTPEYHKAYNKLKYEQKKQAKAQAKAGGVPTSSPSLSPAEVLKKQSKTYDAEIAKGKSHTEAMDTALGVPAGTTLAKQQDLAKQHAGPTPYTAPAEPVGGGLSKVHKTPPAIPPSKQMKQEDLPEGIMAGSPMAQKFQQLQPSQQQTYKDVLAQGGTHTEAMSFAKKGIPPSALGVPQAKGHPDTAVFSDGTTLFTRAKAVQQTQAEAAALKSYTGGGYSNMNARLRGKLHESYSEPKNKNSLDDIDAKNAALSGLLSRVPPLPEPITVYRGQNKPFPGKPGETFTMTGFQSTSVAANFANNWGGADVLEIRTRRGMFVQPFSSHPNEREFLMNHGTKVRVIGRQKRRFGSSTVRDVMVLEVID